MGLRKTKEAYMYGPYLNYDWPGPWHMMWGGFGGLFPMLMMLAFFGVCAWLMSRMHGHRPSSGSALDILGERFAKGEIGKEEFEEKRSVLLKRP
jgi:uncharacterized membrane protein